MINPSDFIHPEDAEALDTLESIPGFPMLVKKFLSMGLEPYMYGMNMASNIRLSPSQLPEIYRHLPPICERMGIEEPEFYLEMNPAPNAYTFGDTQVFITVTSGLLEMMSDNELDAVLAHECGHIACHHVLYHSIATYLLMGADALGIFGVLTAPVKLALLYWSRKSELSCDRAAALVVDPDSVISVMARLAGGPMSLTGKINMEEWARQADKYDEIRNSGLWNKTLQMCAVAGQDHPFTAVRVREVLKWMETEQYRTACRNLAATLCPVCRRPISGDWLFCEHCGAKLK